MDDITINNNALPLSNYSIYSGQELDRAREVLSSLYTEVTIEPSSLQSAFKAQVNGIQLARTSMVFTQFQEGMLARTIQPLGSHAIQLTTSGASTFCIAGEAVTASAQKGVVLPAGKTIWVNFTPMNETLGLIIKDSILREIMSAWTGEAKSRSIVFTTQFDASQPRIASFLSLLDTFVKELGRPGGILEEPAAIASFENTLIMTMLFGLEHNLSDVLRQPSAEAGCQQVRQVEEFIKAHAAEPIDVSTLARVIDSSVSSIYRAFRRHRGYTPMKFLLDTRIGLARQYLLQAHPGRSVTSIAMQCGFAHLGRFALEYKRRFHESPSQTLAHARVLQESGT
jgi:AraC-like DNA-binding protein